MAETKTRPTEVTVDSFIAAVPDPQKRADAETLAGLMGRLSGEPATMWGPSIIGFGVHRYRYESGREGEICRIGFSPRKPAIVVYGLGEFVSDPAVTAALGKVTTGKGCLYIKRLADVDMAVLESLIARKLAAAG